MMPTALLATWRVLATVLPAVIALLGNAAAAADPVCSFGRIPFSCYTGCPANCDSSVQSCLDQCTSGCFCPPGLFQLGSKLCVQQQNCINSSGVDDIPAVDKCSRYGNCSECISSDPDCQWCPYEPDEKAVKGSRCRQRGLNPVCPAEIMDPRPITRIFRDLDFTDDIQLRPQKLQLKLRAGKAEEFTLKFRPSRNFPLDVYFFLDLTGSFSQRFRNTVAPLATRLVAALQGISERYAVAFGGFGDKRAIPYALPSQDPRAYRTGTNLDRCANQLITNVEDCNPSLSFRHTTSFSPLTTDQLKEVLANITIHPNVDSLEGGMDGLVQAITCTDTIGWREQSLRMLLYMSNANFHLAGDGKVGAAIEPNPGQCALEPREENGRTVYDYTKDRIYDYPSVYQLRELIQQSQTNVVFAISDSSSATSSPYVDLKEELNLGAMLQITSLETDSRNLVSVIQSSYDNITQEIRLTPDRELPQVTFTYSNAENCTLSGDGKVCSDVTFDSSVSLLVTVNMTSCLPNTTTVSLRSAAFGAVELELVPLCQCDCSLEQEPAAEECSGAGSLTCGVCQCEEGRSGSQCECEGQTTNTCKSELVMEECSGRERGECDCGSCVCYVQDQLLQTKNMERLYFGEQCQCDHLTSCGGLSSDGQLCSGRGTCDCPTNKCVCTATSQISGRLFTGDMCQCDPDFCFNENFPNRTCAYTGSLASLGEAECGCNTCLCDVNGNTNAIPAGDGTCIPGPPPCTRREQCARCAKDLQSSSTDCDQLRNEGCDPILLTGDASVPESHDQECTFQADDCTHTFYISTANESVYVEPGADCNRTGGGINDLIWIIPVSVIGAILLLGLLALFLVLFIFWAMDRYEFKKFQHTLEEADWVPQQNPIYVSPSQDYTNIAYKRPSWRRQ